MNIKTLIRLGSSVRIIISFLVPWIQFVAPAPSYAQTPQYAVTDLGTLGGVYYSSASGINNLGQVVGTALTSSGPYHAFLYSNGSMSDLGTLGGNSYGLGINNSGQVAGYSAINTGNHAFFYSGGNMNDLGTLGGVQSEAHAINDSGQVAGASYTSGNDSPNGGPEHAFSYAEGNMNDLGTLGGRDSEAYCINNSGQIVGNANFLNTGENHAFLYSGGNMHDLGNTLGGTQDFAYGINNSGQVTGGAFTASQFHAFLYANGNMSDLGTLGGTASQGNGINNVGQVTGWANISSGNIRHAFLFSDGNMYDLNNLAMNLAGSGFQVLQEANAINDSGSIVGYGKTTDGYTHAFLARVAPVLSIPLIRIKAIGGGTYKLFFTTVSGLTYQLQYSSDLMMWSEVGDAITGNGDEMSVNDTHSENRGFWRVHVQY